MSAENLALADAVAAEMGDEVRLRYNVPAANLTTFGLGGPVAVLAEPKSLFALSQLLRQLKQSQTSWRIIGNGSNIVIGDSGVDEVVIRFGKELADFQLLPELIALSELLELKESPNFSAHDVASKNSFLLAWAGVPLMTLSRKMSQVGLSGLEFAAGIPGSVGGAVRMNAGAHGAELSDTLRRAFVVDEAGEFFQLEANELQFSYRHSTLPEKCIVVAALFELTAGDAKTISEKRSECLDYRKKTQPLHLPSAGSVFKNIVASSVTAGEHNPSQSWAAGELLERCGLKGKQAGGIEFSELHANWLVKISEHAQARDFDQLVSLAKETALKEFGVQLETEIIRW